MIFFNEVKFSWNLNKSNNKILTKSEGNRVQLIKKVISIVCFHVGTYLQLYEYY